MAATKKTTTKKTTTKKNTKRTGRPQKVTDEQLIKEVDEYIKATPIPIIAEYANIHGITKQTLYKRMSENADLFDSIKRISDRKEIVLERGALSGEINSTMAIFSLKQMGWKDKWEDETTDKTIKVTLNAAEDYSK